jgi:hypothetical protein
MYSNKNCLKCNTHIMSVTSTFGARGRPCKIAHKCLAGCLKSQHWGALLGRGPAESPLTPILIIT